MVPSNSLSLDNPPDGQEEQEQEIPQEPTYTQHHEVTPEKTSVKTTVVSMAGHDIVSDEELPEEVVAKMVPTDSDNDDISVFSCYECSRTRVKLLPIITEERKHAYCCMRCMTFEALDIHFEEFLNNSETYTGRFHNYLDKQKA